MIFAPPELVEELSKKFPIKPPTVDASLLHWAPLITMEAKRDKWSIHSKLPPPDLNQLVRERSGF